MKHFHLDYTSHFNRTACENYFNAQKQSEFPANVLVEGARRAYSDVYVDFTLTLPCKVTGNPLDSLKAAVHAGKAGTYLLLASSCRSCSRCAAEDALFSHILA